jgi:CYTH domain-containing protein
VRRIADRYIDGTNLRLRQQSDDENEPVFKLTQKLPTDATGARQGLITTMYLTEDEFQLLANLPAKILRKTRYSVPPFGIDVFEDALTGLVLAEAEFNSAEDASALSLPSFIVREVTEDPRFTGGELVRASRQELDKLLAEFQIKM